MMVLHVFLQTHWAVWDIQSVSGFRRPDLSKTWMSMRLEQQTRMLSNSCARTGVVFSQQARKVIAASTIKTAQFMHCLLFGRGGD